MKYISILALVPFAIGLNFLTGQNFFHFKRVDDTTAALYGLAAQLSAYGLVALSRSVFFRKLLSWLFIIQAPLLLCWGIILAMFSGWGDGASKGASFGDVFVWILCGLLYALIGIYSLLGLRKSNP